jgi:N,N'-diacetyllegionaminate synthase
MKPFIIAEAGINHNGLLTDAYRLIDAAKDSGADVVKFQYYDPVKLLGKDSPYLGYATQCMFTRSEQEHLKRRCELAGIAYAISVFDKADVKWAAELSSFMKIASRMNTDAEFIQEVVKTGKPVIMSLQKETKHPVPVHIDLRFMWCVTKYPAQALDYMSFPYSDFYGISSHVPSTDISVYAARHGARVFENHLTLTNLDAITQHLLNLPN